MSNTPRTDGMEPYGPPYNEHPLIHVPKAFARQLERELSRWKQMADWLADGEFRDVALVEYKKLKGETK